MNSSRHSPHSTPLALTALIAFLAFAAALPTQAQVRVVRYGDDRLSGIREVDVLVSKAADATSRCVSAEAPLAALARDVLQQSNIKATISEKTTSWFYSVVITVTSAVAGTRCAAALTTELLAEVQGMPEADRHVPAGTWGSLLVGHMPLIHLTGLVITPAEEHDAAVRDAVRARVTSIAERIRAARRIE
jgi:hypothetical protein